MVSSTIHIDDEKDLYPYSRGPMQMIFGSRQQQQWLADSGSSSNSITTHDRKRLKQYLDSMQGNDSQKVHFLRLCNRATWTKDTKVSLKAYITKASRAESYANRIALEEKMIDEIDMHPVSSPLSVRTRAASQRRHVCPHAGCNKVFSTNSHARRHGRIHQRLGLFECPRADCHATFTRRDNCTKHQKARHKFQLICHRLNQVC